MPAETRGLWCVSAGVFRVQKRAQACESMCLQRSERDSGQVCADASSGQRGADCMCMSLPVEATEDQLAFECGCMQRLRWSVAM